MMHYADNIRLFGAPNGLCSSITEAKHIAAVKEPWRRTNHHQPLEQMLHVNQRLSKLYAMRMDFTNRGMLELTGLRGALQMIGVFSTRPLPYRSHSEDTVEATRELGNSNDKAMGQVNENDDNDCNYEDESEDDGEVNTEEVVNKLASSVVKMATRTRESIYLKLFLHNL